MKTHQTNASPLIQDSTLKTTALLYLREALWNEAYEVCSDLIDEAKKFGAQSSEINDTIVDYLRAFRSGAKRKQK